VENSPSDPAGGTQIVVSNRLPYNLPKEGSTRSPKRNVGGLVNALEPALAASHGSWIGWDGTSLPSTAAVHAKLERPRSFTAESGVELFGVPLSEREMTRYYHGLSNRTLWPLFHNLLDKCVFNSEDWTAYVKVNKRFAETTLARAGGNDRIWVHDYQLMLVPMFLREMGFRGRIDFFLHIPFPPPEIFLTLPWREDLIHSLLCADSCAFHVTSYRDNFVRVVDRLTHCHIPGPISGGDVRLQHKRGTTFASVAPIGIDVDDFERIAHSEAVAEKVERLRKAHGDRLLLFGADRLDYTKGIKERLLAVDRFLTLRPDMSGRLTMVQVVVPSRSQVDEYRTMKREIDQHVGRINGAHGRGGWAPIHYEYRALGREDLVAHYMSARVCMVTPLRDGMNLVAPEFVASRIDESGVLVLSEFAGIAEQLQESLLVNPYDLDGCAAAIGIALEMSASERSTRMRCLRGRVRRNTTGDWAERCLRPLPGSGESRGWGMVTGGFGGTRPIQMKH